MKASKAEVSWQRLCGAFPMRLTTVAKSESYVVKGKGICHVAADKSIFYWAIQH